jgi:RimJ/RimL family protein N-acetyltransferase
VNHPTLLHGETVSLIPLEREHFQDLENSAADKKIWQHIPTDCSDPARFLAAYESALAERSAGRQYPFVIFHKALGKIIGSTRYLDIVPQDLKLEIGFTWLEAGFWGTRINPECKLLLLTHAFETLKARRVQLKTDQNNLRSRKAIEKIGCRFEGILRKDKIRDNGTSRNSAYYSIIDEEWNAAKEKIQSLLSAGVAG